MGRKGFLTENSTVIGYSTLPIFDLAWGTEKPLALGFKKLLSVSLVCLLLFCCSSSVFETGPAIALEDRNQFHLYYHKYMQSFVFRSALCTVSHGFQCWSSICWIIILRAKSTETSPTSSASLLSPSIPASIPLYMCSSTSALGITSSDCLRCHFRSKTACSWNNEWPKRGGRVAHSSDAKLLK